MFRKSDTLLPERYIKGLKRGDGQTFKHLYDYFYERLFRLSKQLIGDEAEADDITLEAFLKLWQKRDSFNSIGEVSGFLRTCVKNDCRNYIRNRTLHDRAHKVIALFQPLAEDIIETNMIRAEVLEFIWEDIHNLPPACKEICILLLMEQLTSAEIASRLGIKPQTVDTQIARAAKHLKTIFLRKRILPLLAIFFRVLS